jgi:sec-independent protein translocase protein TatC
MLSRLKFLKGHTVSGGLPGSAAAADRAGEMPFLDHLEELRWRILWSLLAFVVMGGIGLYLAMRFDLVHVLTRPALPFLDCTPPAVAGAPCVPKLSVFTVTEPFFITMKLGLTLGLLLSFPIIAYQAWAFLSPALHKREKRIIIPALYAGLVLFVGGALLAYFYVLPATVRVMMSFQTEDMRQTIGVGSYIDMVSKLMVSFGLVFELPVVILILSSLGLVTSNFLRKNRRYAVAIMAVGASVLTPGDAISATLYMMIPLLFLYETSIWLAKLMERRRARAAAELRSDLESDVEAP